MDSIDKEQISTVIEIVCKEISNDLVADVPVFMKGFGTLSPYIYPSHKARIMLGADRKMTETRPFRTIKFHTYHSLRVMIFELREYFLEEEDFS